MSKTSGRKTSRVSRTSPTVASTWPQSSAVGASGSWMPRKTSASVRAVSSTSPPASRSTRSRASAASSAVRMPAPNHGSPRPVGVPVGQRRHGRDGGRRGGRPRRGRARRAPRRAAGPATGAAPAGPANADTASCTSCSVTPHGLALLVQRAHVLGEPVGGGAPGRGRRGDPREAPARAPGGAPRPRPRAGLGPARRSRPVDELARHPPAAVRSGVQVEHEVAQAHPVEPADDGVDGRPLLGDEEHPLAVGGERGDQVGDGLRLAGAGRARARRGASRSAPPRWPPAGCCRRRARARRARGRRGRPGCGRARSAPPAARRGHRRAPRRRRGRRARRPGRRGRPPSAAWRTRRCRRPAAGSPRSRARPRRRAPSAA